MSVSTTTSTSLAQATAEKFVAYFSQEQTVDTVTTPWSSLINEEQKEFLASEMKVYYDNKARFGENYRHKSTNEWMEGSGFYEFAWAKHYMLLGHNDFPDVVFKHMDLESAEQHVLNAKKAHDFVVTQKPFWCQAPVAQLVTLPKYEENQLEDMAFYVEEKLPLKMDVDQHKEFWDRIYIHLHSSECTPTFKENMFQLVKQMCAFIENTNFWDVGYKNLPEVSLDGKHICVTDFGGIEEGPTKRLSSLGIKQLARVFDYSPFIEYISERYEEVGLLSDIEYEQLSFKKPKTKEQLLAEYYDTIKLCQEGRTGYFYFEGSIERRQKLAERINSV